jgi:hypothetical protein
MSQETRIDENGFIHHPMLEFHLEDIEIAAGWLGKELSEDDLKRVAMAVFENNDELATRIADVIRAEVEWTIKNTIAS